MQEMLLNSFRTGAGDASQLIKNWSRRCFSAHSELEQETLLNSFRTGAGDASQLIKNWSRRCFSALSEQDVLLSSSGNPLG